MGLGKSLERGMNLTIRVVKGTIAFGRKSVFDVAKYLIVSAIAAVVLIVLGALLGAGAGMFISESVGLLGGGAVGTIIFVMFLLAGMTYAYAAQFGANEFIYSKKRVPYFGKKNVSVAFRWTIFVLAVTFIIVAVVGGLIALGAAVNASAAILLLLLFYLLAIPIMVVLSVILYYTPQELAIKKKGPWEAIVGSYRVIKSNFWETAVFGVALCAVSYIITVPCSVFFILVLEIGVLATLASPILFPVPLALGILFVLLMAAIEGAFLIAKVFFYRELLSTKPRKEGGSAQKKKAKKTKKPKKKKAA